jgi:hypothetical protein
MLAWVGCVCESLPAVKIAVMDVSSYLVQRIAALPEVVAIALGGSQASGMASPESDLDVYVFVRQHVPSEVRLALGQGISTTAKLVDQWGSALEFDDPHSGQHIDAVFFETAWMVDQIDKVMTRCEPALGYSTCFLHTARVARSLHDPAGWFASLQTAATRPYPDLLAQRIIAHNMAVLGHGPSTLPGQIDKAAQRGDRVAINHRVAALLACVFDVVFAANRQPHPGEKRLLAWVARSCPIKPRAFEACVNAVLIAAVNEKNLSGAVKELIDGLEDMLDNMAWPILKR